jgi:membrane protein
VTRLEFYILKSKPVQTLINWLKKIVLPGFEGVSLFDSLNFFSRQIFSNKFYSKASAISFSFIMALPPLMLFLFTLIPYLPLPEDRIISVINQMLVLVSPNEQMQKSVTDMIYNFIHHKQNVLLSFSVLLTLYYSSNGMMGLMNTFEKRDPGFRQRHWVRQRGVAIALTLMLILACIFAPTFLIFQYWVASSLELEFLQSNMVVTIIGYLLIIMTCLLTVAFTYKYGTATESKLRLFSPGAIIATFLIVVLTLVFFYAVNNLVNYDKIYGSIGTLIIFLVWINFMAQILLIGFELNASIIVNRKRIQNEPKK